LSATSDVRKCYNFSSEIIQRPGVFGRDFSWEGVDEHLPTTWNPNGATCFDWSLGLVLRG